MRLSLCLDPGRSWAELRQLADIADTSGWHAIYVCDHFMPHDPDGGPLDGSVLEGWTTLSALAAATTRIRLGTLVLGNSYRNPAVLANMAATLDRISGGRLVLGLGAGWQPNEHLAYGLPLLSPAERIGRLDEACQVIRSLLQERRTTLTTDTYRLIDAPCDPKPVQAQLPLLLGGAGEKLTLRVAARHADIWHTWADPAEFARMCGVLDAHCAVIGRDPASLQRATGGTLVVQIPGWPTLDAAEADLAGHPEEVADQLLDFEDAGADEFIVRDDARLSIDRVLAQIDAVWRVQGLQPPTPEHQREP